MPCTTLRWLVLAATVALLVLGATVAAEEKAGNLRLQRLLTESSCTTGTTANNQPCTIGSDCASGTCLEPFIGVRFCMDGCGNEVAFVALGDGCSCCSGEVLPDDPGHEGVSQCAVL